MIVDETTYPLTENNYYTETYNKQQILLCHSGRSGMLHYGTWLYRHNGKYKKTTPYTIDKDGKIYKHYDPKYYSNILNNSFDKMIIPITLVNEGYLFLDPMKNQFFDWLNNVYDDKKNVEIKKWRKHAFWVKYSNEQLSSLIYLLNELCNEFGIPKEIIPHNVYDEDVDLFKGIVFKSNYIQECCDINPTFNIDEFKNILK